LNLVSLVLLLVRVLLLLLLPHFVRICYCRPATAYVSPFCTSAPHQMLDNPLSLASSLGVLLASCALFGGNGARAQKHIGQQHPLTKVQ
jgi:hypothetical protein